MYRKLYAKMVKRTFACPLSRFICCWHLVILTILPIHTHTHTFLRVKHSRVNCRHHIPLPPILQYVFPKNKDILLDKHSKVGKFRKYNTDTPSYYIIYRSYSNCAHCPKNVLHSYFSSGPMYLVVVSLDSLKCPSIWNSPQPFFVFRDINLLEEYGPVIL